MTDVASGSLLPVRRLDRSDTNALLDDIDPAVVIDEAHVQQLSRGTARRIGLRVGDVGRAGAGRVHTEKSLAGLAGMARLDWDSVDAWFEEDEQVFVHPRNPYTRVDALRSTRHLRIGLGGVALAETRSAVLVFETGLPTRYYVNRTEVDLTTLHPSATVTECPYKGRTSEYWSAHIGGIVHEDLAWSYAFPSAAMLPIAGLVSFYNEVVDIHVDGVLLQRPVTHLREGT